MARRSWKKVKIGRELAWQTWMCHRCVYDAELVMGVCPKCGFSRQEADDAAKFKFSSLKYLKRITD